MSQREVIGGSWKLKKFWVDLRLNITKNKELLYAESIPVSNKLVFQ